MERYYACYYLLDCGCCAASWAPLTLARVPCSCTTGGVVDVGMVAPTDSEGFFEECGFGRGAVVMIRRPGAAAALLARRGDGGGGDWGKRGAAAAVVGARGGERRVSSPGVFG